MADKDLIREHIRVRTIIEVLGKPKEHVEQTIREYTNELKKEEDFIVLNENYSEASEKDNFFSVFVELEMVVKGMEALIGFCFDYMPSSLEIIKPEQFTFQNNFITGMLNDLQARLHNVDMVAKKLRNENDFLKINLNRAIKNHITILLKMKERTYEELSRLTGINKPDLIRYLDQMIDKKEARKDGDLYYTIK